MTITSVCLVGKDGILKEGIKILLEKTDFRITGNFDDMMDMQSDDAGPAADIIICIDEDEGDMLEKIAALKGRYVGSRAVIVSSRTAMPSIMAAFSAGIDGYVLKNISCDGLVGSLRLVASGEKVYPTFMLSALSGHAAPYYASNDKGRHYNANNLSRQELKIVNCLASGESNKIIAHNLNITESTVKVHMKTILRKLGAKNRTQAAIWATERGLSDSASARHITVKPDGLLY